MAVAVEKRRLPIPETCAPIIQGIIERSWKDEPNDRPTFSEVVQELEAAFDMD